MIAGSLGGVMKGGSLAPPLLSSKVSKPFVNKSPLARARARVLACARYACASVCALERALNKSSRAIARFNIGGARGGQGPPRLVIQKAKSSKATLEPCGASNASGNRKISPPPLARWRSGHTGRDRAKLELQRVNGIKAVNAVKAGAKRPQCTLNLVVSVPGDPKSPKESENDLSSGHNKRGPVPCVCGETGVSREELSYDIRDNEWLS